MSGLTTPVDWLEKPCVGYVMNAKFSDTNSQQLVSIMNEVKAKYGDAVYTMPADSLHITLLDWIAPLIGYNGRNKDELFQSIYSKYDTAIEYILGDEHVFNVVFDTINVTPTTIFISGHDNGAFERIRKQYLANVELLPDTKLPPTIIHSSLARFTKQLELSEVEDFISSQKIFLEQPISEFRLARTSREPMLEFEILKAYLLSSKSEG